MRLVYLPRAVRDIAWMRDYYGRVFPEGRAKARDHLRAAERLLVEHPEIGRPTDVSQVRELVIARTPFTFIYRLKDDRIEILRVWDDRADPGSRDLP